VDFNRGVYAATHRSTVERGLNDAGRGILTDEPASASSTELPAGVQRDRPRLKDRPHLTETDLADPRALKRDEGTRGTADKIN